MGLYEQIRDIAKTKGYSINRLEKELGFARSSINKFNKNTPSTEKIQQIADLLGVSVDTLLYGHESSTDELTEKDKRDIAKDLDRIMNEIQNGEDSPLYYNGVEIDDASIGLLRNAIEYALKETKKENKVKYNPHKNKSR